MVVRMERRHKRKKFWRKEEIIEGKEVGAIENIYVGFPQPLSGVPSVGNGLLSSDDTIIKKTIEQPIELRLSKLRSSKE